jgi:phosphoglycolate phosphatase
MPSRTMTGENLIGPRHPSKHASSGVPDGNGYRLAIFDFDGTIADSLSWFGSVVNDVARRYGFRGVHPSEIDGLRRLSAREIMDELQVPMWKLPAIARYVRALKVQAGAQTGVFDGMPSVLKLLVRGGVQLAIVSSDSPENIRKILGEDMVQRFSIISGGVPVFSKARRLHAVLRSAGFERREAIYIGDEVRDLEAAQKLGLAFGAVTWGYTAAETIRNCSATFVFDRAEDVLRIIGRNPQL